MHVLVQLFRALIGGPLADQEGEVISPEPDRPRYSRGFWYRSNDGTSYFRFRIVKQTRGHFLIYVFEQPTYGDRPAGAHDTHRILSRHRYRGQPLYFICWSERISAPVDALLIAREWAERSLVYARTGQRF